MKSILLSLGALCLVGCASVVPGTAILASRLDPLTVDPADVSAFPVLPQGVGLSPDGNVLILTGTRESDGLVASETFTLDSWQGGYRIDPADYQRFREQQLRLLDWAEGPGVDGSLTITLAPCRIGRGPDSDARYSVDVILRKGGARLPLLKNAPLADIAHAFDPLEPCGSA